ncbi:isocitrate lyase/PEP mutase family protein [Actinophytocola gossypii]|uniref:Isocitrate lyase/phosphoenolpyruvate mutase family protein n=1 Tax=Actinophytocola gossypii TaxID=2812003 RepID=A0ABT2J9A3_9PSEU|nr:isocitrate lyase/phosphoenolpyruvate mutase family protein [Actinophytocola gossypii]MCT2584291.1 isocitrate lyase/phosphoenolpyruvate mutase family protein [Actinophytocola gossypii]
MPTHTARLRALHVPGDPLLLPNAWDAASARLVERAGLPAVATGSAAVAESLGFPDHEGTPPDVMFAAIGRIAAAVDVPVTADVEAGYGLAPAELADRLAAAGAAGCNVEDSVAGELVDPDRQASYLAGLRAAGDLVLNARVDVFLRAEDQRTVLTDGIERALAYLAAGADCVYPIMVRDAEVLAAFVDAVRPAPVNAILAPGGPAMATLRAAGVARISLGPHLFRLAQSYVDTVVRDLVAGNSPF